MQWPDSLRRALFRILQRCRHRVTLRLLDPQARTLIDFGCQNGLFVRMAAARGYEAAGTDAENDVTTAKDTADIVTCFEVLEHLPDPVRAIQNLAGRYRRQLIISVPYEPVFSLLRLGWEPEHLWAVTPAVLRHHLGAPAFERRMVLGRYYLAVWTRPDDGSHRPR